MYRSPYTWKFCYLPTSYRAHTDRRSVTFGYTLHIPAARVWNFLSKFAFWCYISVGGHPGVTSVQGWLADYDQHVVVVQLSQWLKVIYHSFCMWKSITSYGPRIDWRGVTSVQDGILADYHQINTYVLKWNPDKFRYPKSLHIWAVSVWGFPSNLWFDAIYPPVVRWEKTRTKNSCTFYPIDIGYDVSWWPVTWLYRICCILLLDH